ncbi:MAG: Hpt domain-containing protein [Solidesulfovibrio sp.]|uniref:Hpt domain-containing protein n=1 Tax=Solidesulfovibrio sp. TaxID=2910990 RepID=UPI002B2140B7|nr:Hpt domain-containing protein [Solidesulfovibrio sp.]MEA4854807.1 Hpt domain-containing protein [Solidesulfovibrio sp.]
MKGMYPCCLETAEAVREAFDPEAARRRMGVGRADFARIFEHIWREVVDRRSLLDTAWRAGDDKAVALHAHTLKTSAATIGAEALRRAAEALEQAAATGDRAAMDRAMRDFHAARDLLGRLVGIAVA